MNSLSPGRRAAAAAAFVCVAHLAVLARWGRFASTDETYFKAAGYNLAVNGRFAAPEMTGIFGLDPPIERIWAVYPPLYPLLFGGFVRLFGFGYPQCMLFDALLEVACAAVACLLLWRLVSGSPWWIVPVAALALLPLARPGRPDQLALALGLVAVLVVSSKARPLRSAALSGLVLGLTAAANVGVAIVLGLYVVVVAMLVDLPLRGRLERLLVCGIAAAAVLALALAPVLLTHPHAYDQFLRVARGPAGVAKRDFVAGLAYSWRLDKPRLTLLAASAALAALSARAVPRGVWPRLWAGPLVALGAAVFLAPAKYHYIWFAGPALVVASLAALVHLGRQAALPAARYLFAIALLIAAAPFLKERWVMATLPAGQSYAASRAVVTTAIPPGASVLSSEVWWMLAGRNRCYELDWSDPSVDAIDYVVLSANGSGAPGQPHPLPKRLATYAASHFRVLVDDLNRHPTTIFGVRGTNSAYGFGPLILARRPAATPDLPRR